MHSAPFFHIFHNLLGCFCILAAYSSALWAYTGIQYDKMVTFSKQKNRILGWLCRKVSLTTLQGFNEHCLVHKIKDHNLCEFLKPHSFTPLEARYVFSLRAPDHRNSNACVTLRVKTYLASTGVHEGGFKLFYFIMQMNPAPWKTARAGIWRI